MYLWKDCIQPSKINRPIVWALFVTFFRNIIFDIVLRIFWLLQCYECYSSSVGKLRPILNWYWWHCLTGWTDIRLRQISLTLDWRVELSSGIERITHNWTPWIDFISQSLRERREERTGRMQDVSNYRKPIIFVCSLTKLAFALLV